MTEGEIKLTPKSLFGYVLFIIGLLLLGYVCLNAIYLASGTFKPLQVQTDQKTISIETQFFFGIMLQIGMYALIIVIASILMKNGMSIVRKG